MNQDDNQFNIELHNLEGVDMRDCQLPEEYEHMEVKLCPWPSDLRTEPYTLNESSNMTKTVLERIQQYIALSNTIFPDWKTYTQDTKQPLDDRWEAFLAAPTDWRKKYSRGGVPLPTAEAVFDSPYDHFHMDLEQTMSVAALFDKLEEFVDDGEFTEDQLIACKEEAIAMNLGSWLYDQ